MFWFLVVVGRVRESRLYDHWIHDLISLGTELIHPDSEILLRWVRHFMTLEELYPIHYLRGVASNHFEGRL